MFVKARQQTSSLTAFTESVLSFLLKLFCFSLKQIFPLYSLIRIFLLLHLNNLGSKVRLSKTFNTRFVTSNIRHLQGIRLPAIFDIVKLLDPLGILAAIATNDILQVKTTAHRGLFHIFKLEIPKYLVFNLVQFVTPILLWDVHRFLCLGLFESLVKYSEVDWVFEILLFYLLVVKAVV